MNHGPANGPVIAFESVHIGFGEGDVLRGLSFTVQFRETKVVIGETGTGKTVALKLAAGLIQPDQGRVLILGRDISTMTEEELLEFRTKVGFVFQEGALFDSLSVAENVAYPLRQEGVAEDEIEERVREALRFVELEPALDKLPSELSGGMRRRVSIARALISRPPILLYDSPTAGLDPITAQTIITLILRCRDTQGVTSLMATHRLQDAFALANFRFDPEANRVVRVRRAEPATANGDMRPTTFLVLRDGRAYFEGDPRAIFDSQDAYLKRFLSFAEDGARRPV